VADVGSGLFNPVNDRRISELTKEHRQVVHAIQRHDAAKAAEIMRKHLGRTARRVKNV
jgi:DNA-binding FadR family transcriptional regulator